jgi:hypothetical protein
MMTFVWSLFNNQSEKFKAFHKKEEQKIFLDIKEEQEKIRTDKAQRVIEVLCEKHGIVTQKEIFNNNDVLEERVKEVSRCNGLSGRKIANLLGVSEATSRRISE